MAVEVSPLNILGGGIQPVTSFADTLGTAPPNPLNVLTPPSPAWLALLLGGDTPTSGCAIGTWQFGQLLSGGGGNGLKVGGISYAFTAYNMATAIVPVVAYVGSPIYLARQKFAQITFNAANTVSMVMGFCNFLDLTGTGSSGPAQINHDGYFTVIGFTAPFQSTLQRCNSGANTVTLTNPAGNVVQGDVIRLSVDLTNPAQVTLIGARNGVNMYTIVDNSALRVTQAGCFPFICVLTPSGALTGEYKNFSCGIGL